MKNLLHGKKSRRPYTKRRSHTLDYIMFFVVFCICFIIMVMASVWLQKYALGIYDLEDRVFRMEHHLIETKGIEDEKSRKLDE